jgi:hypothetical protein
VRPKFTYLRSKSHRMAVAALDCQLCGKAGPSQCAHSNQAIHGKGRGIKASDAFCAALCPRCHDMIDSGYSLSRDERMQLWNQAHAKTEAALRVNTDTAPPAAAGKSNNQLKGNHEH